MSKNKYISEDDFRRYLENRMNETERNRFERELQKQPFEAEALDGFEQLSSNQLQKDIKELKNSIHRRKRNNYRWWAVAASFLLLITTGIFLFQLNIKKISPEVAEIKSENKQDEVTLKPKPIPEKEALRDSESNEMISDTVKPISVDKINKARKDLTSIPEEEKEEMIIANANEKSGEIAAGSIAAKKSVIHEARPSNTDVSIQLQTESLKTKQNSQITTQKAALSIDKNDVYPDSFSNVTATKKEKIQAVSGVAVQDQVDAVTKILPEDVYARPVGGMEDFENYLKRQAMLPANFNGENKTVNLLLKLNKEGKIINIENRNRADSGLFELAKKIINKGPEWKPEIRNGLPVSSEVELKIVFSKQ